MTSLGGMVDGVLAELNGLGRVDAASTHITDPVSATDLVWNVKHANRVRMGRAEIGSELVYVDQVDAANGTIEIAPYGRGVDGSEAVTHEPLTRFTSSPRWPRQRVVNALNETIQQCAGQLFVPAVESLSFANSNTAELPADTRGVLKVRAKTGDKWVWISRWEFNPEASFDDYPSGNTLTVYERGVDKAEAVIKLDPLILTGEDDEFPQVTGLPASCEDVIKLGAIWRLVTAVDFADLDQDTISASDLANGRQLGGPTQIAKQAFVMFKERLNTEAAKLNSRHGGGIVKAGI